MSEDLERLIDFVGDKYKELRDLLVLDPGDVPRKDIRKEGDFYLEKAKLIAWDGKEYGISLVRVQIDIYEDLFNQTLSGTLHFHDTSDLTQFLPLIGEEKIQLRFTRPSETGRGLLDEYFDMEFRIYKMDGRQPNEDRVNVQNYSLHFTSPERIMDMKTKVWESFKEMPYSEMVEKIFNEYVKTNKPIEVEPTQFDHNFLAAGLSPFQIINILASKSVSAEGNGSAYLFYEDLDKFNFKSIGKLMKEAPSQKYLSQLANVLADDKMSRSIEEDVRRVENYKFSGSFDVIRNLSQGMYAQRLVAVDMLRQIHENVDWNYKEQFGNMPHLEVGDTCTDSLDALGSPPAVMKMALTTKDHDTVPHLIERDPSMKPNHVEDYLLMRNCQLQMASVHRLRVNVSGDPRRKVGQVVEYLVPNHYGALNEDHRPDPPHDRYFGGKFLVTSLKHSISASSYYNQMELMKDTFAQEIEAVDLIEQQKWTY